MSKRDEEERKNFERQREAVETWKQWKTKGERVVKTEIYENDKGVRVYAVQVTPENIEAVAVWCDGVVVAGIVPEFTWLGLEVRGMLHYVEFGDYILKDVEKARQRFSTLKADAFEEQYQVID